MPKPIVLTENRKTVGGKYDHWADITGEQYHFPNIYIGRIQPGRRFIYYRGSLQADGRRKTPVYFGHGVVGSVFPDPKTISEPKTRWHWYCEIASYEEFDHEVEFKLGNEHLEDVRHENHWGSAVRTLDEDRYARIVRLGGREPLQGPTDRSVPDRTIEAAADPGDILIPHVESRGRPGADGFPSTGWSKQSYVTGRVGERVALEYLRSTLAPDAAATVRWVADEGKTPGWDIEYREGPSHVAVEVKATAGAAFPAFQLTRNEWDAARRKGAQYRILLVANALGDRPIVAILDDLASAFNSGMIEVEPIVYRVCRRSDT